MVCAMIARNSLYDSLSALVHNGTLAPHQADAVHRALDESAARGTASRGDDGWQRHRLASGLAYLAAGLLATAYLVAASLPGSEDFQWKVLLVVVAVAGVLTAAAAALVLRGDRSSTGTETAAVLASLGLAAVAFAVLVLWEPDRLLYVTAVVLLVGGVAGYWRLGGSPFAVAAAVGGGLLLIQIFRDTLDGDTEGRTGWILLVGIAFWAYGVVVAAVGWRLACRRVLGLLGLGVAVAAMALVIYVNATFYALANAFGPDGSGPVDGLTLGDVRSDINLAMLFGLVAAVLAALAYAYSGDRGFALIAFLGAAILPVSGILSMRSEHPIRWAGVLGVCATVALAAGLLGLIGRRRPSIPGAAAGGPGGYQGAPWPGQVPGGAAGPPTTTAGWNAPAGGPAGAHGPGASVPGR